MIEIWSKAKRNQKLPSDDRIKTALFRVNFGHLVLDPIALTVFFRQPEIKIDFGAVGKGYAVDRAVQCLRARGTKKGIISTGSSFFSLGDESVPFGIRNPREPGKVVERFVLKNRAVSTSALYEQFFDVGGHCYSHLIDPRTGFPVDNELLSVSVLDATATECDILSTSLFMMGRQEGISFVEKRGGTAVFISHENTSGSLKITSLSKNQ